MCDASILARLANWRQKFDDPTNSAPISSDILTQWFSSASKFPAMAAALTQTRSTNRAIRQRTDWPEMSFSQPEHLSFKSQNNFSKKILEVQYAIARRLLYPICNFCVDIYFWLVFGKKYHRVLYQAETPDFWQCKWLKERLFQRRAILNISLAGWKVSPKTKCRENSSAPACPPCVQRKRAIDLEETPIKPMPRRWWWCSCSSSPGSISPGNASSPLSLSSTCK